MAAGDVLMFTLENPTEQGLENSLGTIRTQIGANGAIGAFALDGKIFCWGIEE